MPVTEAEVNAGIMAYGPRKTLESYLLVNNSKILSVGDAWEIVKERRIVVDALVKNQLRNTTTKIIGKDAVQTGDFPFRFGFFAVGGYGRGELSPNSDIDVRLIVDSPLPKNNPLANAFAEDAIYTFPDTYGMTVDTNVHNLSDIQGFLPRDLNAFLDMRLLFGHGDLLPEIRSAIRKHCNLSGLFLHNWRLLQELKSKHPENFEDVDKFNVKYGIGGLRHYHAALWLEAANSFVASREISLQRKLGESMRNSVGILLKTRAWINLEKILSQTEDLSKREKSLLKISHNLEADTLHYRDFEKLGFNGRQSLIAARKEVYRFAESQMKTSLWKGFSLDDDHLITYEGIHIRPKAIKRSASDPIKKTHALLSLLLSAQNHGLSINDAVQPNFYTGAHNWVRPDPLFGRLFYEPGSLSKSLRFLSNIHSLGNILRDYSNLEAGLHPKEHRERRLTRAGFALQKIETKEAITGEQSPFPEIARENSFLSPDDDAAIKLALLIKHIPHSKSSKGVSKLSLTEYLALMAELSFMASTLQTTRFLIENFPVVSYKALSQNLNGAPRVSNLAKIVGTPSNLRSLYVFAHSDYGLIDRRDSPLWNDLRELYQKTMNVLEGKPEEAVYEARAFDNLGKSLLEDLGPDFRSGRYKNTVHYWISALSKVHQNGEPIVQPFSHQDNFLGVACRDYPGLLTVITGQLYKSGTDLLQAHAYSLTKHGLVLDMFEYHPTNEGKDLSDRIKLLIAKKTMIDDDPMEILSRASKKEARLNSHSVDSSTNHYSLEFTAENNVPGIVYALTRILYGSANAHIYGVNAYAYPGKPVSNSIFFSSPLPSHSVGEVVNQKINL